MKSLLKVAIICISLLIFRPAGVSAEVIGSYDVEIVAHQDGSFDVTENISYDFGSAQKHGIFRDIPLISKVGDLYRVIQVDLKKVLRDGVEERYSETSDSGKHSVKIGKADQTITGAHNYLVSYTVKNGIGSNYEDHDEIYWNITGNEWPVKIDQASVKLTTDFGAHPQKIVCYTGVAGSKETDCNIVGNLLVTTNKLLNTKEGLTVAWWFTKDTFPKSVLQRAAPDVTSSGLNISNSFLYTLAGIWLVLNLVLPAYLIYWYNRNKSKRRFGPPTVNFDFPKDKEGKRISPAEAGSIDAYQLDQNDVIATIFDLAIRKYLKIEQVKKEKVLGIFGENEDFILTKLKDVDDGTESFEQSLLHRFFDDGDTINLNTLKEDFYETFQNIEKGVFDRLISRDFYKKNPKNQMTGLLVLGIFLIFFGCLILGPVVIFLSRKLTGRTELGDEIDWRTDGLKLFLKNMSRNYTWQAKNLYTVEKYIPYAIAFGYVKEFMEQLKVIYPDYQPSWYSGNMAFYAMSGSLISSMSSSFTTSAPSSSSGFSGGGSSGGGGGGGGGGSW